ncbi:hypothetical protein AVKW3434_21165 [Acidovorax sp. SUPP3434]|uniref:hypothetical protein n=1 Tax=Acidovorax sp. SUPP3434 TaxID=2920880 RepID=UPI0023DE30F4|nr:hypothetical protein [Acidovorax sp. SUPP3434]GKT01944.1 hypothetical protein AVKW3434_21165 [Acidovorax sp. SUPP3434]
MKRIFARISLFSKINGGRAQAIPVLNFGCPVFFENIPALSNHGYDCRLLMPEYGSSISPGETAEPIPMVFISQDEVLMHAKVGADFFLWEGRKIGVGEILKIE